MMMSHVYWSFAEGPINYFGLKDNSISMSKMSDKRPEYLCFALFWYDNRVTSEMVCLWRKYRQNVESLECYR